jgi:hypothetical protein
VHVFEQRIALEDAFGSRACFLEASMRVTNDISSRVVAFLTVWHRKCRVNTVKDLENASHSRHNFSGKTKGAGNPNSETFMMLGGVDQATGLHHHARITLNIPRSTAATFSVCVLCSANTSGVRVMVTVGATGTVAVGLDNRQQPLALPPSATATTLTLDLFTDGALVELFTNGGQVQPQSVSVKAASAAGVGVLSTAGGAMATLELWRMQQSVF